MITHAGLAAKMLRDAATFFRSIGEQNNAIQSQMNENADVYEQVASMVESDPLGTLDLEGNEKKPSPAPSPMHSSEIIKDTLIKDSIFPAIQWANVSSEYEEDLLSRIAPVAGKYPIQRKTTSIRTFPLPFYKSTFLLELNDTSWDSGVGPFWYFLYQNQVLMLQGNNQPIFDLNEKDFQDLDETLAIQYLQFFCFFVHGEGGPFYTIRDLNHPAIDQKQLTADQRERIENNVFEPVCVYDPQEDRFIVKSLILYAGSLFQSEFEVKKDGTVQMLKDTPLLQEIPVVQLFTER